MLLCFVMGARQSVSVWAQRWKVGWNHSRKKRRPLSLITFDLSRIHYECVCAHTLGYTVSKEQELTMSLPTTMNVWVRIEHTQGGICIWLHSSHCERRQLLRSCRALRDGAWLDLMGHCRFHKLFQGGHRGSSFISSFDEALGQRGVFPKVNELCFVFSRAKCLPRTASVYDTGYQEGLNLPFTHTPDKVTASHWNQFLILLLHLQHLSLVPLIFPK